jgi:hypothetical protein
MTLILLSLFIALFVSVVVFVAMGLHKQNL